MKIDERTLEDRAIRQFAAWRADWVLFATDVFGAYLDDEQKAILRAFQHEHRVSVRSGTARGKDFIAAICALCFFYLTPKWDTEGNMVENTKVALTAPTDRQVKNIMARRSAIAKYTDADDPDAELAQIRLDEQEDAAIPLEQPTY